MTPTSPWLRGSVVVAVVLVLQEAVLRGLRIDGVRPDLSLGVGVVVAVVAGPERGAVVAFAGGLLGDLFVNTPFGLSALTACAVAFVAGSIQRSLTSNERWAVLVLAAVASVVGEVVWAVLGTVLGLPGLLHPRLLVIALVVATVNALVALPVARAARWAFASSSTIPTGRSFAA